MGWTKHWFWVTGFGLASTLAAYSSVVFWRVAVMLAVPTRIDPLNQGTASAPPSDALLLVLVLLLATGAALATTQVGRRVLAEPANAWWALLPGPALLTAAGVCMSVTSLSVSHLGESTPLYWLVAEYPMELAGQSILLMLPWLVAVVLKVRPWSGGRRA